MIFRKTLARGVALALLAAPLTLAVAAEAPAQAATTHVTVTTASVYNPRVIERGSSYTALIERSVSTSDGAYVSGGSVALQASAYPYKSWATIYTTSPSRFLSHSVKPAISTRYRWVYSGGTGYSDDIYTASVSSPVTQAVSRALNIKHKGLHMWGTVKPHAKLKLVFKIKKGKKYKKWFTVKTNKKGKWSKQIHGKTGTEFLVKVPAGHGFAAAANGYRIY